MARQTLSLPFSGQRLRETRERQGLLLQELAEKAGIHPSNMGRYERAGEEGGRTPSAPTLRKLANALGVDVDALLDAAPAAS